MPEQVSQWLREIDEAAVETSGVGARADAKRKAGSRRMSYERGLQEVGDVAGEPQGQELADWIAEEIRSEERFPSAREVRKRGAKIVRESGHEVSTGSWLGASRRIDGFNRW
jgi:hypothetical protein